MALGSEGQYKVDRARVELSTLTDTICAPATDQDLRTIEALANIRGIAVRPLSVFLSNMNQEHPVLEEVKLASGQSASPEQFIQLATALTDQMATYVDPIPNLMSGNLSEVQDLYVSQVRDITRKIQNTAIGFDPELINSNLYASYMAWTGAARDPNHPVSIEITSNEILKDILTLIRSEKLSAAMDWLGISEITINSLKADGSRLAQIYIKHLRGESDEGEPLTGKFNLYAKNSAGQGTGCFVSEEYSTFEDIIASVYLSEAYKAVEKVLGFPIEKVWQGWFDQANTSMIDRTCAQLLYGLGYRIDPSAKEQNFFSAGRSDYPIVKAEVLEGLKFMSRHNMFVVDYGAIGTAKDRFEYNPGDWGPMDCAKLKTLYPNGVCANDLLASWFHKNEIVTPNTHFAEGHPALPTEILRVPEFLRSLGFEFSDNKWIAKV